MAIQFEIKDFLNTLDFSAEEGTAGIWIKKFPTHDYSIRVDLNKEEINYGDKITLGDRTTCNFKASENFVVLECVSRLLEKGYLPEHITLEKDYPLGHKLKGKLDILVTDIDGKAYLMIECKTWGVEYDKATKKTLGNGGQLLSYFQQDKSSQYLCLYTSRLEEKAIQSKYGIIKVEPEFATATNTEEVFEQWNKNLKDNGVFEADSTPYNVVIKSLTKERLIPLTKDDSSRIFNQFAEILRHNVVSDKPNAFNKLITLLLCKIVDEDRGDTDELHFQWLEADNNVALQKRLNDLYKVGMERYLTKVVTDFSDSDVEGIVGLDAAQRDFIKHMITELRLKKNNEFAFKEVFNDPSFEENSKVLREVVELFQPYQVRYNKKQQFLGDFFELLLSTSIKQEAGQFFTPVPVARFIINSLPLKELMISKIGKGDSDFLPYVIDYAVGSGHFLTEAMDEIHTKVKELHQSGKYNQPSIKKNLSKWADDYDWAYDFVYGIEKDYRLVKTAKVSCFLNGDGLARIFNADGLANFQTDTDYKDKLKDFSKANPKDNQQFEVLIANPPYSVSAFRNTLKDGNKSFDLYKRLTEDSSEIECLFIERAKQLLKDGGYAGIILPSSILSNGGIYEDAREIILKYFKLIAITEFGSGTFMATGTNTVTLFLERRNNADWQKIEHAVNTFFTSTTDVTCNGIEAPFAKYIAYVYKTISLEDYTSFVRQKPNEAMLQHELFMDYRKAFDNSTPVKNLQKKAPFKALTEAEREAELNRLFLEDIVKVEKEKLLYFILAYPQKTLLVKANPTGKNEDEKTFLGYEFSNRRGHEGIKAYGAKTIQQATKLYDENISLNLERVNTYIYNAFLKNTVEVNETLQENISNQQLVDMLNFERVEFSKSVSLAFKKKTVESKWPMTRLDQLQTLLIRGKSPVFGKSNVQVIKSGQARGYTEFDFSNKYFLAEDVKLDERKLQKGDILINSTGVGTAGRVTLFELDGDYVVDSHITILRPDISKALPEYILSSLANIGFKNIEAMADGQSGQIELAISTIRHIRVPLPPLELQGKVVNELEVLNRKNQHATNEIQILSKELETISSNYFSQPNLFIRIGEIAQLVQYGISIEMNRGKNGFKIFRMNEIIKGKMTDNGEMKYADISSEEFQKFKLQKGDILFNRTNSIELVGKTGLFDLEGDYCFASYLVRLRVNTEKAIPVFVNLLMNSNTFQTNAKASAIKAVKQANINAEKLKSFQIPLPSIEEQKRVAYQIEDIETKISILEKELANIPQQKEAILKKHL